MRNWIIILAVMLRVSSIAYGYVYSDYTWYTYNGHQYAATFVVGPWEDAQAEAAAIGASLVAINDSLENDWLTQQFDNVSSTTPHSSQVIWIGLNLVGDEWVWLSGEPITYWNVCEHCFRDPGPHMYLHTSSHSVPGTWNYNNWHDTRPTHYLHGVIEISEPTTGPVAYWSFDDVVDPGHDDSGNGHDGTVNGATSIDGICGKGLYFDGSGDYVDVPDASGLNPTSAITVAAWIKVSSFPGTWPPIVKKYDDIGPHHGYSLEFCGAGIHVWFLAQLEGGTGQTDYVQIQTPINRWHFVVAVYDGSAFTLYVDGVPSTPQNFTGNIVTSSYNLNIGRDPYNTNRFFHGIIDEVRIYDRALSAEEIAELMPEPNIAVSPLSHDFGDVEICSSETMIISVSNIGDADLTIDSIAFQSGSSSNFSVTSALSLPAVIAPAGTIDVEVTFAPTTVYYSSAVLEISSDDVDESLVDVSLGGVGVWIEPPPDEQIEEVLDFIEDSVADGNLAGEGLGNSADKKLNALVNMIEAAGDLIDDGLYEMAHEQLESLYKKCDGQSPPPDFVTGPAAAELAEHIQTLMENIIDMTVGRVVFLNDVEDIPSLWTIGHPSDVIRFTGGVADDLRALEGDDHLITIALFAGLQFDGIVSSFLASEGNLDEFFDNIAQNMAPELALGEAGLGGEALLLANSLFQFLQAYSVAGNISSSTDDVYIIFPEYPHYEIAIEEFYYTGFLFAVDDLTGETLGNLNLWVDAVYYESLDEEAINPDGYSLGKANYEFPQGYVPVPNNYERSILEWKWVAP